MEHLGSLRGLQSVRLFRGGLVVKAHRRVHHSTLGSRVIKKNKKHLGGMRELQSVRLPETEFFIDNLLVRIEMIVVDQPCAMGV